MSPSLLEAKNIRVRYPIHGGVLRRIISWIHAVEDASIKVRAGEIISLVGESGCGKSSFGMALLGLVRAAAGEIALDGEKLVLKNKAAFQKFRRDFQIIFQDPYSALNPRHTVFEILAEPLLFHGLAARKEIKTKIAELLEKVGLSPSQMYRYPHAFSGGQRQRICIARVISLHPRLIICDEIVSALDLSVQAQIIQLLLRLKKEMGLSLLWISHDLSLVRNISDYVHVMYLGRIVESGKCPDIFIHPAHPYTKALIAAIPTLDREKKPVLLQGEPPSLKEIPEGCAFHTRCPALREKCKNAVPLLEKLDEKEEGRAACFFPITEAYSEKKVRL